MIKKSKYLNCLGFQCICLISLHSSQLIRMRDKPLNIKSSFEPTLAHDNIKKNKRFWNSLFYQKKDQVNTFKQRFQHLMRKEVLVCIRSTIKGPFINYVTHLGGEGVPICVTVCYRGEGGCWQKCYVTLWKYI